MPGEGAAAAVSEHTPAEADHADTGEAGDDNEPKGYSAISARRPAAKPQPKDGKDAKAGKTIGKAGADAGDETDAEYEYEVEVDDEENPGQRRKVKEKLTKKQVNEYLARRRRLENAAYRKLEDLNGRLKKAGELDQLAARVKQNPLALFDLAKRFGLDPHEAATAFAKQHLEEQELTEEERRARALQRENEELRRKVQDREDREQQDAVQAETEAFRSHAVKNIGEACDRAKMPRHPASLALINAQAAAQIRQGGLDALDFDRAAEDALDFAKDFTRSWLGGLQYEALVNELPPEVLKTIRAGDVARAGKGPLNRGHPSPAPRPKTQERQYKDPQSWRESLLEK